MGYKGETTEDKIAIIIIIIIKEGFSENDILDFVLNSVILISIPIMRKIEDEKQYQVLKNVKSISFAIATIILKCRHVV